MFRQLLDWYHDLYWPWDQEDTLMGLRYGITGMLLLAAFVSLILNFLGGGGKS